MITSKITAFVTRWTHRSTKRHQIKGVVCASSIITTDILSRDRDYKIIITREDNQQVMISFNHNHASYIRDCFDRYLAAQYVKPSEITLNSSGLPEVTEWDAPYSNGAD